MMLSESTYALTAGTKLGEYRIVSLLGEGSFGLTYLAFDEYLKKQVAIKEYLPSDFAVRGTGSNVVPKTHSAAEEFRWGLAAFVEEARTLAKFRSPNIVEVYRYFEGNGTAYIVMEYVEGATLTNTVKELNNLNEKEVKSILIPILDGLADVHDAGILHRDIKPENILIRDNGRPVLIDFGAARQALGSKSRSITTILTPGYAPIEQYSTKGNVGPWSDIYSLAAVAYFCLTGSRPEDATDRVVSDIMPPLIMIAGNLGSKGFLQALDEALAVTPSARPQSLEMFVGNLTRSDSHANVVKPVLPPDEAHGISAEHYELATREVDGDRRNQALWSKALALAEGNSDLARFKYIKIRAAQLVDGASKATPETMAAPTAGSRVHDGYVQVETFAEIKGVTVDKIIAMIRDGSYQGRQIDGAWFVTNSELPGNEVRLKSETSFSKLINGHYGLAKTYWLFGILGGLVMGIALAIADSIAPLYFIVVCLGISVPYKAVVLIAVWRASRIYKGAKIWVVLAKLWVVFGWVGQLFEVTAAIFLLQG